MFRAQLRRKKGILVIQTPANTLIPTYASNLLTPGKEREPQPYGVANDVTYNSLLNAKHPISACIDDIMRPSPGLESERSALGRSK